MTVGRGARCNKIIHKFIMRPKVRLNANYKGQSSRYAISSILSLVEIEVVWNNGNHCILFFPKSCFWINAYQWRMPITHTDNANQWRIPKSLWLVRCLLVVSVADCLIYFHECNPSSFRNFKKHYGSWSSWPLRKIHWDPLTSFSLGLCTNFNGFIVMSKMF